MKISECDLDRIELFILLGYQKWKNIECKPEMIRLIVEEVRSELKTHSSGTYINSCPKCHCYTYKKEN